MRLERLEIVSSFDHDEFAAIASGVAARNIASRIGGALEADSILGLAPPEATRLHVRAEEALVAIALNRFTYALAFPPPHSVQYGEALDRAVGEAEAVLAELYKSGMKYAWTGIVADFYFPSPPSEQNSGIAAVRPIARRVLRLDGFIDSLSAFQCRVGHEIDGKFRTYDVRGYERRELLLAGPSARAQWPVYPKSMPPDEFGVNIVLDVNNKPSSARTNPLEDLYHVAASHRDAHRTLRPDLGLEGVLP